MYRWPLLLSYSESVTNEASHIEVSTRGAVFGVHVLAHYGHPTHFSVIDANLRGEIRLPLRGFGLGRACYAVAASIVGPLAVAYAAGQTRSTLTDWTLLAARAELPYELRLGAAVIWHGEALPVWQRFIDHPVSRGNFSEALDPREPIQPRPAWRDVVISLPNEHPWPGLPETAAWPSALNVGVQPRHAWEANGLVVTASMLVALRKLAHARMTRVPAMYEKAVAAFIDAAETFVRSDGQGWRQLEPIVGAILEEAAWDFGIFTVPARSVLRDRLDSWFDQIRAVRAEHVARTDGARLEPWRNATQDWGTVDAPMLSSLVPKNVASSFAVGTVVHDGLTIDVALAPEADGGATLALLPPVEPDPIPDLVERMEAAARVVLVGLMGVPFAEDRKEPIEHRLVGPERTTTLLVGWSLVLPRNRRVFAAWLGSDGRVMIRLFPPEGRPARGRL